MQISSGLMFHHARPVSRLHAKMFCLMQVAWISSSCLVEQRSTEHPDLQRSNHHLHCKLKGDQVSR